MRSLNQAAASTKSLFKSMSGKLRASCAAAALGLLAATSASAVPVTYLFRGDFDGAINGTEVHGPLTITATGDTDEIRLPEEPGDFSSYSTMNTSLSVNFDLAGYGSFSASPAWATIWTRGTSEIDFGLENPNEGTVPGFALFSDSGQGYDMSSFASAGPLALDLLFFAPGTVETGAGSLRLDNMSNITFQAIVQTNAVPEPGSLALFGGAGLALLLAGRRRKPAKLAN